MTKDSPFPLVAVDIGNSRIKLGLFAAHDGPGLPVPERACSLEAWDGAKVHDWLEHAGASADRPRHWWISSVDRPVAAAVLEWLERRPDTQAHLLTVADLPLTVALERPDLVGMDRLVNTIAANRLREPGRPAIVIDVGSAITVDLVGAGGEFAGGAILPGIAMSARALHDFTDLLPLVPMSELGVPPPPLGTGTIAAMRSGLFWGAVGAMRELCQRLSAGLPAAHIFLTGGAAATVASLLAEPRNAEAAAAHAQAPGGSRSAEYVPHLTLGGIALAAATGGGKHPWGD